MLVVIVVVLRLQAADPPSFYLGFLMNKGTSKALVTV